MPQASPTSAPLPASWPLLPVSGHTFYDRTLPFMKWIQLLRALELRAKKGPPTGRGLGTGQITRIASVLSSCLLFCLLAVSLPHHLSPPLLFLSFPGDRAGQGPRLTVEAPSPVSQVCHPSSSILLLLLQTQSWNLGRGKKRLCIPALFPRLRTQRPWHLEAPSKGSNTSMPRSSCCVCGGSLQSPRSTEWEHHEMLILET